MNPFNAFFIVFYIFSYGLCNESVQYQVSENKFNLFPISQVNGAETFQYTSPAPFYAAVPAVLISDQVELPSIGNAALVQQDEYVKEPQMDVSRGSEYLHSNYKSGKNVGHGDIHLKYKVGGNYLKNYVNLLHPTTSKSKFVVGKKKISSVAKVNNFPSSYQGFYSQPNKMTYAGSITYKPLKMSDYHIHKKIPNKESSGHYVRIKGHLKHHYLHSPKKIRVHSKKEHATSQNKHHNDYSFYNPLISLNYPSLNSLAVLPVTPAGINTISLSQPVATQFYTLGPDVSAVQNEQKPVSTSLQERVYGNFYPYQNVDPVLNSSKILTWFQNPYPLNNPRKEQLLVEMNNVGSTSSNLPFFGTNQGGVSQGISSGLDQSIYYNANNVLLQSLQENSNQGGANNNLNTQMLSQASVEQPTGSPSQIYTFYETPTNQKGDLNGGLEIAQPGKISWMSVKKSSDEPETEPPKMIYNSQNVMSIREENSEWTPVSSSRVFDESEVSIAKELRKLSEVIQNVTEKSGIRQTEKPAVKKLKNFNLDSRGRRSQFMSKKNFNDDNNNDNDNNNNTNNNNNNNNRSNVIRVYPFTMAPSELLKSSPKKLSKSN